LVVVVFVEGGKGERAREANDKRNAAAGDGATRRQTTAPASNENTGRAASRALAPKVG